MNKLEVLKKVRDDNFKKIGQYQLQKLYYEQNIEILLKKQQELCNEIFTLERKSS